ncbi:hypothetical protein QFZ89_008408 [Paraburkholderia youngii]
MATIERTAYPRFPKVLATRDLQPCYTPYPMNWNGRDGRPGASAPGWVCWCS